MLPIRTILHPTDFSPRSEYALHLAAALARDHGAELVILHVLEPPIMVYGEGMVPPLTVEYNAYREQMADKLTKLPKTAAAVLVQHRLVEGNPPDEILKAAEEGPCDLIVMGTHGRTGLSRLLMGSVAEQVVRRARCPVLTVKEPFPAAEPLVEAGPATAQPSLEPAKA